MLEFIFVNHNLEGGQKLNNLSFILKICYCIVKWILWYGLPQNKVVKFTYVRIESDLYKE